MYNVGKYLDALQSRRACLFRLSIADIGDSDIRRSTPVSNISTNIICDIAFYLTTLQLRQTMIYKLTV